MNKFFIYIIITFTAFTSVQAQHPRVCDYVSLKHALKGREIDFMSPGPYTEGFVQTVKHSKEEIRIGVALPIWKRILVTPQYGMDLTKNLWTLATRVQYCVNNFLSFYTTSEYVFLDNSGYFNDPYDMAYYMQGFCIRAGISLSLALNTKNL